MTPDIAPGGRKVSSKKKQRVTPAITQALVVAVAKDRVLTEKSEEAALALQRAQQKHKEIVELKVI